MHDKIKAIAARYHEAKDQILTEEASKHSLVLPFLAALGYDVFNPLEVVPEFVADIGVKKGEKIDYAIRIGQCMSILIECKGCSSKLSSKNVSQLFHYFTACKVHLAILTNGLEYQFFADVENENRMDEVPFFTFNILNFDDSHLIELRRFTKADFDAQAILAVAKDMKDRAAVKAKLEEYYLEPSENFVKSILADLNFSGMKTQQVVAAYGDLVKKAFSQMVKERVADRLKKALRQNQEGLEGMESVAALDDGSEDSSEPAKDVDDGIVTTLDEIEGFAIIKAIAREIIPGNRVHMRDAKSYCAILLDNNNRKPIVRLHFNNPENKRLSIFAGPADKKGEMVTIGELDDMLHYAGRIIDCIRAYDEGSNVADESNDPPITDLADETAARSD